ncbi:MAG: PIG-L family deacetylase [Planctomycetes bacterium]|nr:PIG-L family deacetylase [Planctomycetota bacterium]
MHTSNAAARARRLLDWTRSRFSTAAAEESLGRSAVLFAPHPDDETLGAGGTIIRKTDAGAPVTLVFMTDGSRSHRHLMPVGQLRELRLSEARAAGMALGVRDTDMLFLGHEDGALESSFDAARAQVAALLRERRPDEVFLPYARETPADHRATRAIVLAALGEVRARAVLLEYPVWFWAHWPFAPVAARCRRELLRSWLDGVLASARYVGELRHEVDVRGVLERKRAALEKHRSQVARLVDDPRWLTLADVAGGAFLRCFFQEREVFRRSSFAP